MFTIRKAFTGVQSQVAVFSMVGNERYFLPHFLAHYRAMGISEFHFLVDRSDDGTLELLIEQPDCAVITSRHKFGDQVTVTIGGRRSRTRFATVAKLAAARAYLMDRWCLIVDADEFLVLPPNIANADSWRQVLEENHLDCCRALMVDCFPRRLSDVESGAVSLSPFDNAPHYDLLSCQWPSGEPKPSFISYQRAVRARMTEKLTELHPESAKLLSQGVPQMLYKTPLHKVTPNTFQNHPHDTNHCASDQIQVALAHFKFFPGWQAKARDAVNEKQYMGGSIKYQPLVLATEQLTNWSMLGEHSIDSRERPISESPMVFNRLISGASTTSNLKRSGFAFKTIVWQLPNRAGTPSLHIANRGERYSTVTGVAWIDQNWLVAAHRDGMSVALFDTRKGEDPVAIAELPHLVDSVDVKATGKDIWEVAVSGCWHANYTKLRLIFNAIPKFERLSTQWDNRETFCHGVSYDSDGRLWLALHTGRDPRIEIDGGQCWRLPKPWGCRHVCFDKATGAAYAIAVSDNPKRAAYSPVKLRVYTLSAGSTTWALFSELENVHADAAVIFENILWINDQYADRVLGLSLVNGDAALGVESNGDKKSRPIYQLKMKGLSFPHGIAVSPEGVMAVSNYGTSSICFINLPVVSGTGFQNSGIPTQSG